MPAADIHTGMVGRNQRQRDADIAFVTKQSFGVIQLESQSEQCRNRPERDVTLIPCDPNSQRVHAVVHAVTDHAEVGNSASIRPRIRTGKRKTRHFQALGQSWQIIILLLIRAVVQK